MSVALRDRPTWTGTRRHRRPPGGDPLGLAAVPPRVAPAAARPRPAHGGGRGDVWGASVVTNCAAPAQLCHVRHRVPRGSRCRAAIRGWPPTSPRSPAAGAGRPHRGAEHRAPALRQSVQLRAESRTGTTTLRCSAWSAGYPAGPRSGRADQPGGNPVGAHVGGTWHAAGTTWQVTGIVQDPSTLADQFALVAPGQIRQSRPGDHAARPGRGAAHRRRHDGPGVPAAMFGSHAAGRAGLARRCRSLWWRYSAWRSSACCRSPVSPCWPSAGSVPSACSARSARPNATSAWS